MIDPLQDGISRIELLSYMGGDLDIVNDAKASFNRVAQEVGDRESRLIDFLISPITEPQHTSPLRGTVLKFRVKAPLFICRQWWKYHVSSCHSEEQDGWNEQSFRYVEAQEPEFYIPQEFRSQAKNNKQASGASLDEQGQAIAHQIWTDACHQSFKCYQSLIKLGVAREQARCKLTPDFYTTWVWTVSLQSALNLVDQREGCGTQSEFVAYAEAIKTLIQPVAPIAIDAWNRRKQVIKEAMELWHEANKEEAA